MSDTVWYYASGQDRKGPVREDQLGALADRGEISESTLVWRSGMSQWAPAGEALPATARPAAWSRGMAGSVPPVRERPSGGMPTVGGYSGGGGAATAHPTTFQDSVKTVFNKYATFTGRARRPEYWWFVLFTFAVNVVLSIVDAVIFGSDVGVLSSIFALAVLVPSIAVGMRRLHDTGRTGWWLLIGLVPLVGLIVLIIFMAQKGEEGTNQYGPA